MGAARCAGELESHVMLCRNVRTLSVMTSDGSGEEPRLLFRLRLTAAKVRTLILTSQTTAWRRITSREAVSHIVADMRCTVVSSWVLLRRGRATRSRPSRSSRAALIARRYCRGWQAPQCRTCLVQSARLPCHTKMQQVRQRLHGSLDEWHMLCIISVCDMQLGREHA